MTPQVCAGESRISLLATVSTMRLERIVTAAPATITRSATGLVTVSANACPALVPIPARSSATPSWRDGLVGGGGKLPAHPTGVAEHAQDQADDERAAGEAERQRAAAGKREGDQPEQHAGGDPDRERQHVQLVQRAVRVTEEARGLV